MAPVTITALTNRIAGPSVKDCLAQPLKFRLASDAEDSVLAVPPPSFVVLKPGMSETESESDDKSEEDDDDDDEEEKEDESEGDKFEEPKEQLFAKHRLPVHWTQKYSNAPGFINNGVTCYMNSVLQVLLHVPAMVEYLLHVHRKDCTVGESCIMCAFCKLADECYPSSPRRKPIYPRFILKKLKQNGARFSDHRQEDAHEFLRQFIDALQLSVAPKSLPEPLKETSVIHRIFGGRFRQQIRCRKCDYPSNTFQPTLDMQLDIGRGGGTVEDALKKFFAGEQLTKSKGNAYKCERCKTHVDAEKRSLIYDAPEYVTLHLKRFDFTMRGTSKIHDFVKYPRVLDLSPYSTRNENLVYELMGVIVHQGRRTSSGHYYAFCKQSDGTWANYNDEVVDSVSEKTALKQEAYMLFYVRTTSGVPSQASPKAQTNGVKHVAPNEHESRPPMLKKRKVSGEFVKKLTARPMVKLFDDDNFGEPVSREEFEHNEAKSTNGSESDGSPLKVKKKEHRRKGHLVKSKHGRINLMLTPRNKQRSVHIGPRTKLRHQMRRR
ncbi:hypothetical protein V1512DRAFT_163090 [Lipomyces arxii]|uniref:uncharacterized protein n=1 Tax=Lipomyces arxii TaxID=56418 RepID=UPI0034CF9E50